MRKIISVLCAAGIAACLSGCVVEPATETVESATETADPEQKISEASKEAVELHKALNEVLTDMYGYDKAFDVKGVLDVKYDSAEDRIMVKSEPDSEWQTGNVYGCDFDRFAA